LLGMSFFGMGKYQEAIDAFNEELIRFPDTDLRSEALKFMGMSYFMIGDTARGSEPLKKFLGEGE
jgi:TolA-binding protein